MVRIRLMRMGRKNRPFFRIVAIHSTRSRDGRYIENLGTFDPLEKEPGKKVKIRVDRYRYWLGVGAVPSSALDRLLKHTRVLQSPEPSPAPGSNAIP